MTRERAACMIKEAVNFSRSQIEFSIPTSPGIYIFWSGRLCLYVGKATNLRQRLISHWRESHNDDLNVWIRCLGSKLCVSLVPISGDLQTAEQALIDRHRPHLNRINAKSG
jgi:excinuclease UvrABC nuclease subunit